MKCYNTVKVDIDVPFKLFKSIMIDKYITAIEIVVEEVFKLHVSSIRVTMSPGLKTHVYVELKECVDEKTIILLQFFCYSDHKRFVFNLDRLLNLRNSLDRLYPP